MSGAEKNPKPSQDDRPTLRIRSYRRAEDVEGGPGRPAWIHVDDGQPDVGVSVLVEDCNTARASVVADAIVELLPDATLAIATARAARDAAERRADRAYASERDAKDRLDAVLHGRRRLFGEALVRVDDNGAAWLLDPVKRDRGFGLRYPSLADLWRAHPELRPVRWDDGDLIVDATIALGDQQPLTRR